MDLSKSRIKPYAFQVASSLTTSFTKLYLKFLQSIKTYMQSTGKHRNRLRNFGSTKGKRFVMNYISGC